MFSVCTYNTCDDSEIRYMIIFFFHLEVRIHLAPMLLRIWNTHTQWACRTQKYSSIVFMYCSYRIRMFYWFRWFCLFTPIRAHKRKKIVKNRYKDRKKNMKFAYSSDAAIGKRIYENNVKNICELISTFDTNLMVIKC